MPRGVEVSCMHRSVKCHVGEVVSGRLTLMSTEEIMRYVLVICGSMKNEDLCDATTKVEYLVVDLTWRRQPRDHLM